MAKSTPKLVVSVIVLPPEILPFFVASAFRAITLAHNKAHTKIFPPVARIHDLEVKLARANKVIELYKHEQSENTKLLAEYEESMGDATDKIRNYCCDNEERYLALRKHYNNLLQQEKDEHLQSRLERDDWHAKCMRVCEMIRTAHRLRNEEDHEAIYVVARLQAEVRIYRRCLGMDQERPEAEAGWAYLRTAQSSAGSTEET